MEKMNETDERSECNAMERCKYPNLFFVDNNIHNQQKK